MTLRKGHGNGAGVPRIEVLPADELPSPNPTAVPTGPLVRRSPTGTFADSASAREAGRRGGVKSARQKAHRTRLMGSLGLVELAADHKFYAYEAAGEAFVQEHMSTLATMFDGTCSEGPMSIVRTAGIQLAASRFLYDEGKAAGDAKLLGDASKLGDASRQNILAAYELQAREAAARKKSSGPSDPLAKWRKSGGET